MQNPADYDEIDENLGRNRERILLAMFRHGDLKSREIRNQTGLSRGAKDYHINVLEEWGLAEEVDRVEDAGGPFPERVFGLTDEGREFTDDYLTEEGARPNSYEMRVQRLEDEVDDLKTANERLEDEIEQLREDREQALDDLISNLEDKLNGEYRALLKEDILDELEDDETRQE